MSEFPVESLDEVIWRCKEGIGKAEGRHNGWLKMAGKDEVLAWVEGSVLERLEAIKGQLREAVDALRCNIYTMCLEVKELMIAGMQAGHSDMSRTELVHEMQAEIACLEKILFKFIPNDYFQKAPGQTPEGRDHAPND